MKIICSFLPLKESEEEKVSDSFSTVARALGMAITAIDSAPVKLYTVELKDVCGSEKEIYSAL